MTTYLPGGRDVVFVRLDATAGAHCKASGMQRDQRHPQARIFKQLAQALFDHR